MSASREPDEARFRRQRRWINVIVSGVLVVVLAGVTVITVTQLLAGVPQPGSAAAVRPTPTPIPTPTMDPFVARELRTALHKIRALPGVASATDHITLTYTQTGPDDPLGGNDLLGGGYGSSTAPPLDHTFHSQFAVAMTPAATAAQTAAVVLALGRTVGWTGVDLALTTPPAAGRVATSQFWSGTFDGNVGEDNATGVSNGLFALATTPGVQTLEAGIPYTGRVDYGSLTIGLSPADDATKARVLAVVATTAFADTTLHGSFGNGAKP